MHEETWRGPIITPPEELTSEQLSTVPELPTERTATELLDLLAELAERTGRDEAEYVQLVGAIRDHGQVGLYQVLAKPGSADVVAHTVAWRHDDEYGFSTYPTRELAERAYDAHAEEVDVARRPT